MEEIIADPICCALREDTFLAETRVKPGEPERPRKTEVQKQAIKRMMIDCLDYPEKLLFDL